MQTLAERILYGQREFDRMKEEIKTVIGTVASHINPNWGAAHGFTSERFAFSGGFWKLAWAPPNAQRKYGKVEISCHTDDDLLDFAYEYPNHAFVVSHIPIVHKHLNLIVKVLFQKYPALNTQLKPYLEVADKIL